MVAFVEKLAFTPETPLRVRAQDHRCILGVSHCSKSSKEANLHAVTYDESPKLESCSKDPIGRVDGPNLYRAYFVLFGTDPSGLRFATPHDPTTIEGCNEWYRNAVKQCDNIPWYRIWDRYQCYQNMDHAVQHCRDRVKRENPTPGNNGPLGAACMFITIDLTTPEPTDLCLPKVGAEVIIITILFCADAVTRPRVCPPCPPPPLQPPELPRVDRVPPSRPHAPRPGDHLHVYWWEVHQESVTCQCLNNNKEYVHCL